MESGITEAQGGDDVTEAMAVPTGVRVRSPFRNGRSLGMGSLPHRDNAAAAAFAMAEFDIATIPTLPRRSPAEALVAQAIAGLPGVSFGQYGSMAIDSSRLAAGGEISSNLDNDAFGGLRAFLDLARRIHFDGAAVKWQFVGPVTLGVALVRAGLDDQPAFQLAAKAVRHHVADISARISEVLPNSPQLLLLDEPGLVDLMEADFPVPPDLAVDLMSTAMAAVPASVMTGLHCCGPCDVATMLTAGPRALSIPASPAVLDWAGYLQRFLDDGGTVVWGVIQSDGPISPTAGRPWQSLSSLWCDLVERGCDPSLLRRQSLVSPTCGLGAHSVSVARRVARLTTEVGQRVQDQAHASRFAVGA